MADNKKSFVAYCDWKETFNALPDEIAGKLVKHLFAYVNDENPESEDVLINAVFANIKQTLKRDLVKYQKIREKRSEAGKASASKRQQVLTNVESVEQTLTKSTVSVNDSVSVNVNDNVNVNEINNKKYKDEIKNFTTSLIKHFDSDVIETLTDTQKWAWVDCVDKLNRIDKYSFADIEKAVKNARSNDFWQKNFITLMKLRKNDKDGIKYIKRFLLINNKNGKNDIAANDRYKPNW